MREENDVNGGKYKLLKAELSVAEQTKTTAANTFATLKRTNSQERVYH